MKGFDMANATTILPNSTLDVSHSFSPTASPTYFTYPDYSSLMLVHIVLMTAGWLFVLPIGVMLSLVRSRLALPTQLSFLSVNAIGLVFGTIYNSKTPDLYENNAHHKFGWVITGMVSVQMLMSLMRSWVRAGDTKKEANDFPTSQYHQVQGLRGAEQYRYSRDSGQGTEPNSPRTSSPNSIHAYEEGRAILSREHHSVDAEEQDQEKEGLLGSNNIVDRFLARKFLWVTRTRGMRYLDLIYGLIDRTILIFAFVAILTGGVTYGGIFTGHGIFSGLAHFAKGGIFFWYGLLTLSRYFGAFAEFGWSWNIASRNGPSAEFVESFLIFFYGASNVFLEHLGSWGGAWSAGDLEHVSISIMFFGGGLCGMLVESSKVRDLLNSALGLPVGDHGVGVTLDIWQAPKSYRVSTNPLPGIIILLLGILMSGHHQESVVSTMLHKQWGTLFVGAALARGVTYILLHLSPPTSLLPSRPPSELVVAFCLVSGGLIFMSSNTDMVAALEARDLNAMFMFTVMMGLTAFLMAWAITVLAVKAWAVPPMLKPTLAASQLA